MTQTWWRGKNRRKIELGNKHWTMASPHYPCPIEKKNMCFSSIIAVVVVLNET